MLAEVAKLFCLFSLFFFLHFYKKKKTDKTGKPSWLLKLHHATINKGVVKKKSVGERGGGKKRGKDDGGEKGFLCKMALL